ncbi:MAG: thioredoxin-disulfide reductase [Bacillota bacterium]|jgi:thioredoxin reductase (NADPH)|nr:thioredoxin-disulfide reductase [Bacillota bacterium]MDD3298249.1 thioredoxin-disulfide reductase [Bacillota bacterium]MDD3851619.1 thioredoxin-disulfide reductase [Bacillota bacterium]MDD4708138.1 thioredoxin-disulfide reductase [Bacillota bacterium]
MQDIYDIIIIGGGPAGLSAGLYGARSRAKTLILEKGKWGGQAATTEELENYPGSIEQPTGPELTDRMKKQAEEFGVEAKTETVTGLELGEKVKKVVTENAEYFTKTIIIATGAKPRLLGCPGELELRGKGVSYCATCDADFFTDLRVVVVGGGDAAIQEAIYLTKFAEKVTVIHRRDQLRAAKSIQEKAFANDKIDFIWDSVVTEIKGDGIVESVVVKNVKTNVLSEVETDGVFMFVGYDPVSELFKGMVNMDERGYIITDENMSTSVEGVFAAGDVRVKSLRQVVTAASDGAIAAVRAEHYITEKFE